MSIKGRGYLPASGNIYQRSIMLNARRCRTVFLWILLVLIAPAFGVPRCISSSLPKDIQSHLQKEHPGWAIVTASDLREDDQALWGKGGRGCAGIVSGQSDALIAFVGFDPRPRESGKYRGKRKLSKRGDPEIRRLGYMAAKTFARLEIGQPLYERYRQRGFSATATYVILILARKILHLAHALVTKNTFFDAKIFAAACNPT
jgi:Transposase IS116/IS110/IS902 family